MFVSELRLLIPVTWFESVSDKGSSISVSVMSEEEVVVVVSSSSFSSSSWSPASVKQKLPDTELTVRGLLFSSEAFDSISLAFLNTLSGKHSSGGALPFTE